jgi:membrane protein
MFLIKILGTIYTLIRDTIYAYLDDKVEKIGASLAYYTIFSLPALLIILISLVGMVYGEAAVQGQLFEQLHDLVGTSVANQIQESVKSIGSNTENGLAAFVGIGMLIFVATGIFFTMQEALNIIFEVQVHHPQTGILWTIINRIVSFGMILMVCVLFVVAVLVNTVLIQVSTWIAHNEGWLIANIPASIAWAKEYVPIFTGFLLKILSIGGSIFLLSLFFGFLYKILPAVKLSWSKIVAGALFAASLFYIGQLLMGYYLAYVTVISAYGAAGSLIILLIWVYYSSQLVFLGAEFIKILYKHQKLPIVPKIYAKSTAVVPVAPPAPSPEPTAVSILSEPNSNKSDL